MPSGSVGSNSIKGSILSRTIDPMTDTLNTKRPSRIATATSSTRYSGSPREANNATEPSRSAGKLISIRTGSSSELGVNSSRCSCLSAESTVRWTLTAKEMISPLVACSKSRLANASRSISRCEIGVPTTELGVPCWINPEASRPRIIATPTRAAVAIDHRSFMARLSQQSRTGIGLMTHT